VLWILLLNHPGTHDYLGFFPYSIDSATERHIVFASVIFFGIIERLGGIANMLTMERDWVPAVADPTGLSGHYTLTTLNAKMRRIDLICKLFAPLFISAIIEGTSTPVAVIFLAISNILGLVIEPRLADFVYARNEKLRVARVTAPSSAPTTPVEWSRPYRQIKSLFIAQHKQFRAYLATNAWLPSLSLTLLYFSALSYSATFVTWLLSSGFTLLVITTARTVGSIVEVASTFVAPFGIHRLARVKKGRHADSEETVHSTGGLLHGNDNEEESDLQEPFEREHLIGLARSGLWGVVVQFVCLVSQVLLHSFYINNLFPDPCGPCHPQHQL
jgi:iron-regulated transporter 1